MKLWNCLLHGLGIASNSAKKRLYNFAYGYYDAYVLAQHQRQQ